MDCHSSLMESYKLVFFITNKLQFSYIVFYYKYKNNYKNYNIGFTTF